MDSMYDTDTLTWSERQAVLLRRLAAGERVNEELDWANVIEEIESVGRSEWQAVESWLMQALLHDLKSRAWPESSAVPHWRAEARLFRKQARRRYTESMRQRIDLASLYDDARSGVPETIDGQPPRPISTKCPITLDELLADN